MGLKSFTSLQLTMRSIAQVVLPDAYVPGAKTDSDQTVNVNDNAVQETLTSDTTPAPTEIMVKEVTIPGGGSQDIDLTAAPIIGALSGTSPAASEDITGKILTYLEIHTDDENSGSVTVAPGSSNGFPLFGASIADGVKLPADSHLAQYVKSGDGAEVGAAAKIVTVSGTAADVVTILMVFEDAPT